MGPTDPQDQVLDGPPVDSVLLQGEDHHGVLHGEDQYVLHVVAEGYTITLYLDTSICCLLDVVNILHGVLHWEDQYFLHVVSAEGCTLTLF